MASHLSGLECLRCGAHYPPQELFTGCPRCLADGRPSNVTPTYRYDDLRLDRDTLAGRPHTMWRYRELLPVTGDPVTLAEGGTPLLPARRLGAAWRIGHLLIKDESRNPTGSFKDRMASVTVTHAREMGYRTVAIASSGNAGAALAAYAARAGLDCVVLTVASAPPALMAQMQALGAKLVATASPQERWTLLRMAVEELGWYPAGNFLDVPIGSNPYGVDGYKTIALEILESLDWHVPAQVFLPVCYGDGLWGVAKGFAEAYRLGLADRVPTLVAGEVFGPLATALAEHLDDVRPVPTSRSVAISIAAGVSTYQALHALRHTSGAAYAVDDAELLDVQTELGVREGIFAEASSVASLAAVRRMAREGALASEEPLVALMTATGLKDPGVTQQRHPAVPVIAPTLSALRHAMRVTYGLEI